MDSSTFTQDPQESTASAETPTTPTTPITPQAPPAVDLQAVVAGLAAKVPTSITRDSAQADPKTAAETSPDASDTPSAPEPSSPLPAQVRYVPLAAVEADPDQPRQRYDADQLKSLAEDIARHNIDQPLTVRPIRLGGESSAERYQLVAGERRFRAARLAGLSHVPVLVREDLSDEAALLLQLRENLHRADLSPIEEARGFLRYKAASKKSWKQVSQEIGWAKPTVLARVNLLKAPAPIQALLDEGTLPPSYYKEISALPEEEQVRLAQLAAVGDLNIVGIRKRRGGSKENPPRNGEQPAQANASAEAETPAAALEGLGTETPSEGEETTPTLQVVQGGADPQEVAEEEPSEETTDDTTADAEDLGTETPAEAAETEKGVEQEAEVTKELRVSLGIEDYERLEGHAAKRGKSLQGFTRLVLIQVADLLDAGRWDTAVSSAQDYRKAA